MILKRTFRQVQTSTNPYHLELDAACDDYLETLPKDSYKLANCSFKVYFGNEASYRSIATALAAGKPVTITVEVDDAV